MSTTLYRKYRPQKFEDLVGQGSIKTTLRAEIETNKIVHAYLFIGPRGVGKTTTARIFTKAVNCTSPKGAEPDNTCQSCVAMNEGRSLDCIEIDAASHTQVDHVRENILPAARTAPASGKYKVFIIDEVHMLSASAFNALLKMLEEPPAHAIFILATTEPHRVPETIISRCQRFDFHKVGVPDIVTRLEKIAKLEHVRIDQPVRERIARAADGSLRDAEGMFGQMIGLGEKNITDEVADLIVPRSNITTILDLVEIIRTRRTLEGLQLVERLVEEGVRLAHFMRETIELIRGLLLLRIGMDSALPQLSVSDRSRADRVITTCSVQELRHMLEVCIARERDERSSTIPQLPLELAIIELTENSVLDYGTESHRSTGTAENKKETKVAFNKKTRPQKYEASIDVVSSWPTILARIAASNPSVSFLLKTATPHDIIDGTLTLSFPYTFHSERVIDRKNKAVIEKAISDVVGTEISISTETLPEHGAQHGASGDATSEQHAKTDVWQQALRTFGENELSATGEDPSP